MFRSAGRLTAGLSQRPGDGQRFTGGSGGPAADQPDGRGDEQTDSASSQPPSIHWNGQNRLPGW